MVTAAAVEIACFYLSREVRGGEDGSSGGDRGAARSEANIYRAVWLVYGSSIMIALIFSPLSRPYFRLLQLSILSARDRVYRCGYQFSLWRPWF